MNPTDMSLTDKDRIDVVQRVYGVLRRHRDLARYYTRKNISISLLRAARKRDMGRCALIVRNRRTALLVVWYACFPLRRICTRFSRVLYDDMMALCYPMSQVAMAIAGIGALLYIAYRVWQSMAQAEPIDLFPLMRPFAIGICILFFPTLVLGSLNGILLAAGKGHAFAYGRADARHATVAGAA